MEIRGKKVAVVGAGCSGIAAARVLSHMGAHVRLLDRQEKEIKGFDTIEIRYGEHSIADFEDVSLVVLSPGVPIHTVRPYIPSNVLIISEIELGFRFIDRERVIAITGTNGKTTTVGLISHIFKQKGIDHFVGGNFGVPLCEYILSLEKKDVVLLEVSSFQLQNIVCFRPHIGVFLNFSANHLDYHRDMKEYLNCKMNIFKNQKHTDYAIINDLLKPTIEKFSIKSRKEFFSKYKKIKGGPLLGEHNLENIGAAWSVCNKFQITPEEFEESILNFNPFPHRIEFVAQIKGVTFYNDSKSTTLESLRAAINSFDGNIHLLVGGILKGGDPEHLISDLKQKVGQIVVFGESSSVFLEKWSPYLLVYMEQDLKKAVRKLFGEAKEGDIILFSPGCSSFDMFSNYKERGEFFKQVVKELSYDIKAKE